MNNPFYFESQIKISKNNKKNLEDSKISIKKNIKDKYNERCPLYYY